MVFQELNLFGNLSVAENIFATREITNAASASIDRKEQERRAGAIPRAAGGRHPIRDTLVEDLRIGQQQLVEIAKAVSLRRAHPDHGRADLGAERRRGRDPVPVIADLKARGVAIVYISHRLEELIRIGDYITVLRDGRITGQERDGGRRHRTGSCGR